MPFEVIACDPETGILLADNGEWFIRGQPPRRLRRLFETHACAREYADALAERFPAAEIAIVESDASPP